MPNYSDYKSEVSNPKIVCNFKLLQALCPNYQHKITNRKSPSGANKLTKAEAFFDLVNRQRLALITTGDDVINISVISLSDSWGWNRKTTRNFLEELVEFGVLIFKPDANRTIIQLTNIIEQ